MIWREVGDAADDDAPAAAPHPTHRALLIAGIILIALNLRPALAAVGPLVSAIRSDTGLSNTALGLLTTLPLLGFGVMSTLTSLVSRRSGMERALAGALLLLTIGILLRVVPSVPLLYAGTAVLGVAIAFGNVLLPSLVKRDFPDQAGIMTSVYSSAMGLGATIAAAIAVPLAQPLGWRGSLGAWAGLSLVALILWMPQTRYRTLPQQVVGFRKSLADLGRSPLAWSVATFMGLQSMTFYIMLAWLPEILQDGGMSAERAGLVFALSQATGIVGTMVVPIWADRLRDQKTIIVALTVLEAIALVGLLFWRTPLAALWVSILGLVLGGTFGLALLLIVLRARNATTSAELSGMAQSVGYLLAAAGPALFGYLHDAIGDWDGPLLFLFAVLIAKTASGLRAARDELIGG